MGRPVFDERQPMYEPARRLLLALSLTLAAALGVLSPATAQPAGTSETKYAAIVVDAATGEVLFQYDTAHTYEAINGIAGKGGGIDNASIVATNGLVFVNSGYGLMGGQGAGNVFLAFRRKAAH